VLVAVPLCQCRAVIPEENPVLLPFSCSSQSVFKTKTKPKIKRKNK